MISINSTCFGR